MSDSFSTRLRYRYGSLLTGVPNQRDAVFKYGRGVKIKPLAREFANIFIIKAKQAQPDERLVQVGIRGDWETDNHKVLGIDYKLSQKTQTKLSELKLHQVVITWKKARRTHAIGSMEPTSYGRTLIHIDLFSPDLSSSRLSKLYRKVYLIAVHELTHAHQELQEEYIHEEEGTRDLSDYEYYSHPSEVEAYVREIVEEIRKRKPRNQKQYDQLFEDLIDDHTSVLSPLDAEKVQDLWRAYHRKVYRK